MYTDNLISEAILICERNNRKTYDTITEAKIAQSHYGPSTIILKTRINKKYFVATYPELKIMKHIDPPKIDTSLIFDKPQDVLSYIRNRAEYFYYNFDQFRSISDNEKNKRLSHILKLEMDEYLADIDSGKPGLNEIIDILFVLYQFH